MNDSRQETTARPGADSRTSVSDTAPVFVVGCQRSGTSALWNAVRSHPDLALPETPPDTGDRPIWKELWFLREFLLGRETNQHRPHADTAIDREFVARVIEVIDEISRRHWASPTGRWVSAHPADGVYIEQLLELFPAARALFLTRHPQEVVWSALHARWVKFPNRRRFLEKGVDTARWWRKFAQLAIRIRAGELGERVTLVRHEDMIERPAEVAELITHHLRLSAHQAVAESLGTVFNSSFLENSEKATRVTESRGGVGEDRELCRKIVEVTGDLMGELGYADLSGVHEDPARTYRDLQEAPPPPAADPILSGLIEFFESHPRRKRWVYHLMGLERRRARRERRQNRHRQRRTQADAASRSEREDPPSPEAT